MRSQRHVPARDLQPGQYILVDELANPEDPLDKAQVFGMIVAIEPLKDAYRVHVDQHQFVFEGDVPITVEDRG